MAVTVNRDTQALARLGFRYSQLRIPKNDRIVKEGTGRSYLLVVDELVDRGDCPKYILTFVSSMPLPIEEDSYGEHQAESDQQDIRLLRLT